MTTKIYAHRGASQYAPENTLAAFQLAYDMKADGIETDVQLTKDRIPILIHDECLDRTTDGLGYVKDYTLAELKELDAGSWFSKEFTNTKLITLEEFLKWIRYKPLYLNIELKNNKIDYDGLETIVYDMVKEYQLVDRTTLSTFSRKSVQRLKKFNQQIEIAYLTSKRNKKLLSEARDMGANAIHIHYKLLHPTLMAESIKLNMNVRVYTVNKRSAIHKCFQLNTAGIFTDVPDVALAYKKDIV